MSATYLTVVSVVTKIRILKQITTIVLCGATFLSCICSNKDKNFKANHNLDSHPAVPFSLYL